MESKKRTKKIKDTQKQKEIPKVAEEDNCETMEVQAENSLVGFNLCWLNYFGFFWGWKTFEKVWIVWGGDTEPVPKLHVNLSRRGDVQGKVPPACRG